ncbi:hypothetical protein [Eudoraea chungangensis]|nr:hypothetical protein [Eudoraea chungangensis]
MKKCIIFFLLFVIVLVLAVFTEKAQTQIEVNDVVLKENNINNLMAEE